MPMDAERISGNFIGAAIVDFGSILRLGIKEKDILHLNIIRKDKRIINVMPSCKHTIVNCPNTAVLQMLLNLTTMNPVNPY